MTGDAGARRYYRLPMSGHETRVLMDAPDQIESCRAYLKVGQLMIEAGLHVPQVYAVDLRQGLMLLEDLGSQSFLDALVSGDRPPDELIKAALNALVQWQVVSQPQGLEVFDAVKMRSELDLFPNWYVRHAQQHEPNDAWFERWNMACNKLLELLAKQPQAYVHRDFMSRNLLISEPLPGVIDFQDACIGPVTYDVLSLLRDAFWSFSEADEQTYLDYYAQRCSFMGVTLPPNLPQAVDVMGVQRHFKVLGIFARLCYRDGKPHYLDDAPRFFNYLNRELQADPALEAFAELLAELP